MIRQITDDFRELQLHRWLHFLLLGMYALYLFYAIGFQGDLSRLPWLGLFPIVALFVSGKFSGWMGFIVVYLGVILFDLLSPAIDTVDITALRIRTYLAVLVLAYVAFALEREYRRLYLGVHSKNAHLQRSEKKLRSAYDELREEIVARREIENALTRSEDKFVRLFDTSPVLTSLVTIAQGRFIEANQAFYTITGYTRAEVIGKCSTDFGLWPDVHERNQATAELANAGRLDAYPIQLRMKSGAIRNFLWSAQIVDSFEEPCTIDCLVDVTDRYAAEEALRESERRYRDIFENVSDFLYFHDLDGNLTETNFAFKEKSGFSEADIRDLNGRDMMPAGGKHLFDEYLERVLTHGRDEGMLMVQTLEGRRMVVEYRNALVYGPRGPIGVQGSARDVTDRVEAEEKLQEANRLLEARVKQRTAELEVATRSAQVASRAKTDFLATMSHELRTPLNHIIGFSEVILDSKFGGLNAKQHQYLGNVLQSGRHLLSLVNDILDLPKVESGKMELDIGRVSLKPLLENSLIMVKEKALRQHLQMALDCEAMPAAIEADERKLKQIMYNLLSNAVKFTPAGGQIRVGARACTNGGGSRLEISVADTGIGLDAEDRERIFEPFEQVDGSTSRHYEGTGLGLPLTRRFVELHGGRIWVESEGGGQGNTFRFEIPMPLPEDLTTA